MLPLRGPTSIHNPNLTNSSAQSPENQRPKGNGSFSPAPLGGVGAELVVRHRLSNEHNNQGVGR